MHLVEIAVEPASRTDAQALGAALTSLLADDPSFSVVTDPLSGEPVLQAMSEEALVRPVNLLRRFYDIRAHFRPPRAACREALGRSACIHHGYKRQSHGPGQYAVIKLAFEPRPPLSRPRRSHRTAVLHVSIGPAAGCGKIAMPGRSECI